MTTQDYHHSITANVTPSEAIEKISHVDEWWATHVEGNTQKQGGQFTIRFGDTNATFKVAEIVPDKKVVWHVTDCNLHWLADKKEWKGTDVVFDLSKDNDGTRIEFTHVGLLPAVECYNDCIKGWGQYLNGSLLKLLNEGKGYPDKF